jgi:hypothetical protein
MLPELGIPARQFYAKAEPGDAVPPVSDSEVRTILLPSPFLRTSEPKDTSAADLKSLTHSRENRL